MTRIAYQGAPGAYSELAARTLYPKARLVPTADFAGVVCAVAGRQGAPRLRWRWRQRCL